jgi:lipopolysaccharide transport system ATP-binding protein
MADVVLEAEGLGKRYVLGGPRHDTLRDALSARLRGESRASTEFWALRDVSFRVERGDLLGIVGRNGAGKSTLLKLLSRVTEPSTGRFRLRGRVASLLEVGTGFHPELTGRENVYLNGAVLGMGRAEIRRKFDEIVAFSEIERFLDTPVKRYSSGMYMRLAFAIAAHLEPDVLIVDEVLAVGDLQFQRKCLGKMGAVAQEGRTVLFVSHNLTALVALCRTGLLLESGQVVKQGSIGEVTRCYVGRLLADRRASGLGERPFGFRRVALRSLDDDAAGDLDAVDARRRYRLELDCRLPGSPHVNVGFTLLNDEEVPAMSGCVRDSLAELPDGEVRLSLELPVGRLPSGRYRVEGAVWDGASFLDQSDALLTFDVVNPDSALDVSGLKPRGATLIELPWSAAPGPAQS